MPRWLSSQKLEIIKALLADDPALLLRESMGVSAEETVRAFKEPHVLAFVDRPAVALPYVHSVITSVDPSGGGSSAFAVCSVAQLTNGDVVVCITIF
jgi:hypothetical protein